MMCRVVARSNADLQRVLDLVVVDPSIERSSTTIALANRIPHRVLPLLHAAVATTAPTFTANGVPGCYVVDASLGLAHSVTFSALLVDSPNQPVQPVQVPPTFFDSPPNSSEA